MVNHHSSARRVLINTLPKSGTHLLSKAVELFGYREHFDIPNVVGSTPMFLNYREAKNAAAHQLTDIPVTSAKVPIGTLVPFDVPLPLLRQWLAAIAPNRYILGHITWTAELAPLLTELEMAHVAIIRDPRAVVASLLSFVLDTRGMPNPHFLEADFKKRSRLEQLDLILTGGYATEADLQIQNFAQVYRAMLAWQNEPDCLLLRFEDLIGEQGGGSEQKQQQVMEKIAQHLDCPITSPMPTVYNTTARTFRQGKIDSWKDNLEADVLDYLTDYCLPLCDEAGY
jgi:Sulfotransferase domain